MTTTVSHLAGAAIALLATCDAAHGAGRTGGGEAVASDVVNAGGACGPSLPAYDSSLRRRPLAFANEGASAAFLSCSLQTNALVNMGYFDAIAAVRNRGANAATVSCTLVGGGDSLVIGGSVIYMPQTQQVPAGGTGEFHWVAAGKVEHFGTLLNLSCRLDPGIELTTLGGAYRLP